MAGTKITREVPQSRPISSIPMVSGAGLDARVDLSPIDRLAGSLLAKADRDRAYDDRLAGLKYGGLHKGIDENGNPIPLEDRNGRSIEWYQGYRDAAMNNAVAGIEFDMRSKFNEIDFSDEIPEEHKTQAMLDSLQARVETLPPEMRPDIWEKGYAQIAGRDQRRMNGEQEDQLRANIGGIMGRITGQTDEAISVAVAGGDAEPFLDNIQQAYSELARLNRITPEEADRLMEVTKNQIFAGGLQGQLVNGIFTGQTKTADIKRFATALSTGSDFNLERMTAIDEAGNPLIEYLSAGNIRKLLKDPKVADEVAANLTRAANLQEQLLIETNKSQAFYRDLFGTDEYTGINPEHYDDLEDLTRELLGRGAFNSDEGINQLLDPIFRAKRMPKALVEQMKHRLNSGNPADVQKVAELWNTISNASLNGHAIGQMTIENIGDDANYFDSVADMASLIGGLDDPEAQQRLQEWQRNRKNPDFAIDALEAQFNFQAKNNTGWFTAKETLAETINKLHQDHFGSAASPTFIAEMKRSYQLSMMAIGDPEVALSNAFGRVSARYEVAPWAGSKVARVGDNSLKNPKNVQPSGGKGEYTWLDQWMHDTMQQALINPDVLDLSPADREELTALAEDYQSDILSMKEGGQRHLWLEPTTANRNAPEYRVFFQNAQGEVIRLTTRDEDGYVYDFLVNPGAHRAQQEGKAEFRELQGKLLEAGDAKETQIRVDAFRKIRKLARDSGLNLPALEERGVGIADPMDLESFVDILGNAGRQIVDEFEIDTTKMRESLDKQMDGLEKEWEEFNKPIPRTNIKPEHLLQPGRYGEVVTDSAIDTVAQILPGINRGFLKRTAKVESNYGSHPDTMRTAGDIGIMQINTKGAYPEVKRLIRKGGNAVAWGAQQFKRVTGIDLLDATPQDLQRPLINVAFAALYYETVPYDISNLTLEQEAAVWKKYYNTTAGSGTTAGYLKAARA